MAYTLARMIKTVRSVLGSNIPEDYPEQDLIEALNEVHREKMPEDTTEGFDYTWQNVTFPAGISRLDMDTLFDDGGIAKQYQSIDEMVSQNDRLLATYTNPKDYDIATLRRRSQVAGNPLYILIEGQTLTMNPPSDSDQVLEVPGYVYPDELSDTGTAIVYGPRARGCIYGAAAQIAEENELDYVVNYARQLYATELERINKRRLSQSRKVRRRASF